MAVGSKTLLTLSIAAALLAGCGGSSKPSYCSSVTNLENSIKALPTTDVIKNGTSAVQSALSKVENNAKAVVDAAKSDFPNETNAVKSSVDSLSNSVSQLGSSATPATIAQVGVQASAVVTAVKNLVDATSSKCG
jgi:phage-related protein